MPRGIALDGRIAEFRTKDPEKLYRLADVVQELQAQGWDIVPNRRERIGFPFDRPRVGEPVLLEYRRKCGAKRQVATAWNPDIHRQGMRMPVTLKPLATVWRPEDPVQSFGVIYFECRGLEVVRDQFGNGPLVVVYEEV